MKPSDAAERTTAMTDLWALCRDLDIASNAATEDTVERHVTYRGEPAQVIRIDRGRVLVDTGPTFAWCYPSELTGAGSTCEGTDVRDRLALTTDDPRAAQTAGGPANTAKGC